VSNVLGIGVPNWTATTLPVSSLGTRLPIRTLSTWIWIRALLSRAIMLHSMKHGTFNLLALLLLSFCMILASRLTMRKSLSLALRQICSCRQFAPLHQNMCLGLRYSLKARRRPNGMSHPIHACFRSHCVKLLFHALSSRLLHGPGLQLLLTVPLPLSST
jgi:hypothetical protein